MKYLKSEYEVDRANGSIQVVTFNEISITDDGEVIVDYQEE